MIRAIFLDVDGTLISFKTHEIPASARDALVRAHAQGIRLFIATGRAANDLAPLEGIPYDGVVSLNGARCVAADGRVVSQHLIPRADFERAMELSSQMGFPLALELERGVFVNRVTPEVERLAHMVAHPVPEQTDLRALFDRSECCQMCFYLDTEAERRVMAQLPGLAASRWCPIFADINVAGIDKATGKTVIEVSPDFYRPTDVVNLWGDPSKAKRELGWNPTKTTFEQLVKIMVDHDMKKVAVERAEEHIKTNLAEYLEKGVIK